MTKTKLGCSLILLETGCDWLNAYTGIFCYVLPFSPFQKILFFYLRSSFLFETTKPLPNPAVHQTRIVGHYGQYSFRSSPAEQKTKSRALMYTLSFSEN